MNWHHLRCQEKRPGYRPFFVPACFYRHRNPVQGGLIYEKISRPCLVMSRMDSVLNDSQMLLGEQADPEAIMR